MWFYETSKEPPVKLKITVHGVAYEVEVEVLDAGEGFPVTNGLPSPRPLMPTGAPLPGVTDFAGPPSVGPEGASEAVTSPVAGTVQEIKTNPGANVAKGDVLVVIEAMKMNTAITAARPGKVGKICVAVGDGVREGQTLVEFS